MAVWLGWSVRSSARVDTSGQLTAHMSTHSHVHMSSCPYQRRGQKYCIRSILSITYNIDMCASFGFSSFDWINMVGFIFLLEGDCKIMTIWCRQLEWGQPLGVFGRRGPTKLVQCSQLRGGFSRFGLTNWIIWLRRAYPLQYFVENRKPLVVFSRIGPVGKSVHTDAE